MGKLESALQKANDALDRVTIRQKGGRLYLRATLPPKPDDGDSPKQYEISTGAPFSPEGLAIAKGKAMEIEGLLLRERFDWSLFLKGKQKPPETIGDWLDKFEEDYWSSRNRSDLGKQSTWQENYRTPFNFLPSSSPLSESVLRATILSQSQAETRKRVNLTTAYQCLANFAGLECNLRPLGKGYKAKGDRHIPSDEEILEAREAIANPAWRWVFGILATFGIRDHEIFHLDTTELANDTLRVKENTKTGKRLVLPVPTNWCKDWELEKVIFPNFKNKPGTLNKDLGAKISSYFYDHPKIKFTPYGLRDRYAIRCAIAGCSPAIVAQWMGHSIGTHCKHYLKWLNEIDSRQAWELMKGK